MEINTVEREYEVARKETDNRRLEALHSYDYKKGSLQPAMVIDVRDYDSLVKYIEYLENVADELSVAVMKGMKPKGSTIAFNRPSSAVALGTFEERES